MSKRLSRVTRRIGFGALLAAVLSTVTAIAFFTSTGTKAASAHVGSLAPTSITSTSTGAGTATITWSAVNPPASGGSSVTYTVTRDGTAVIGCTNISSTTCTDSGLSKQAYNYAVIDSWQSWSSTSTAVQVSVAFGAPSQLVFTTQPDGSATGGLAFPQQPVVTAEDAGGHTVTTYSGTISLTIKNGTGAAGATLSSCNGTLSNGVTSFTGCKIDKAGTSYQLTASDGSISGTSNAFDVSVGPASQLAFTTQPDGSATGGVAFPTQPKVTAEDAGGNTVTTYTGIVGLSIKSGTGTGGATLSGCSGSLSAGATTFSGCKIDKAGTGYQLNASDGALNTTSNAFNISVGPASQLVFTTQPDGSATGGSAFPQQPVLTTEDAGGNTVTSYAGTVSLAIKSGTGAAGATLSGCTGTLSSGVTSFAGCKIDKAGSGYQLSAADGSLNATSNSFNVSVGSASQLVFTQQPDGSPTAGVAFPTQPKLTVEDAGGNVVTADSSAVTLAITSGTPTSGGPGTLSGCTQTGETNGVISFSGCKIDAAGTSYRLHATDGSLTATNSAAFDVSATPVTATSVVQATATGTGTGTLTTPSFGTVPGDTYLIALYCQGVQSACGSSPVKATITGGPFQAGSTNIGSEGTSNTKDCVEFIQATGNGGSGSVTVNGSSGNVIFVTVVHLANGTLKSVVPLAGAQGASSPATAALGSSSGSWLVPVAVTDGNGGTTITAPTGMALVGNALKSTTAGAELSVYFGQSVSGNLSFTLNPTTPTNGWATLQAQLG